MSSTTADDVRRIREKLRLTQSEMAEQLGVPKSKFQNWEYGKVDIPDEIGEKIFALERGDTVGPPKAPIPTIKLRIPYIGPVAASSPVDWSDPFESTDWEDVPYEMGDGRGRYSAKVVGLSMSPLLMPDDLLVFQSSNIPKLGIIVMHRSNDNKVTVKVLKQDGLDFVLSSVNTEVPTVPAEGLVIGHLVGIVRTQGSRVTTEFDPDGIRP